MDLQQIVDRFAEGIAQVDLGIQNQKHNFLRGKSYSSGVKTLGERDLVEEVSNWWIRTYPSEFSSSSSYALAREVKYTSIPYAKCDLVFSSDGSSMDLPEWAIEVKHISFIGNNGKNNDFNVQKMLSPYLKDRSLIHDIKRLGEAPMGRNQAVLGYCFEYSHDSVQLGRSLFSDNADLEVLDNIEKVLKVNKAPLEIEPIARFANQIFVQEKLAEPIVTSKFNGAWTHPAGGAGTVFAWKIL